MFIQYIVHLLVARSEVMGFLAYPAIMDEQMCSHKPVLYGEVLFSLELLDYLDEV